MSGDSTIIGHSKLQSFDACREDYCQNRLHGILYESLAPFFPPILCSHLHKQVGYISRFVLDLINTNEIFECLYMIKRFSKKEFERRFPFTFFLIPGRKFLCIKVIPVCYKHEVFEGTYKKIKKIAVLNFSCNNLKDFASAIDFVKLQVAQCAIGRSKSEESVKLFLHSLLMLDYLPDEHVAKDYNLLSIRFLPFEEEPAYSHVRTLQSISHMLQKLDKDECIPEDLRAGKNYKYRCKIEYRQKWYRGTLFGFSKICCLPDISKSFEHLKVSVQALLDIALVLDRMERRKIRHGDVKPKNMFLDEENQVFLADHDFLDEEGVDLNIWKKIQPENGEQISRYKIADQDYYTPYAYWDFLSSIGIYTGNDTYGFMISALETIFPKFVSWWHNGYCLNLRDSPQEMLKITGHGIQLEAFILEQAKSFVLMLNSCFGEDALDMNETKKINQSPSLNQLQQDLLEIVEAQQEETLLVVGLKQIKLLVDDLIGLNCLVTEVIKSDADNRQMFDQQVEREFQIIDGEFFVKEHKLETKFSVAPFMPVLHNLMNHLQALVDMSRPLEVHPFRMFRAVRKTVKKPPVYPKKLT